MGFGKSFIEGLGSSTASTGAGFFGNALSQAFGLSWSPQKAMEEQWKYNYNYRDWETDRKSTRLNSSHITRSRMPSSA